MGKRKRKTEPVATTPKLPTPKRSSDKLRLGLLAATVGVLVARPIVVNESAVLGDGLVLVMLLLLVGLFWAVDQVRRPDSRIRFSAVDAAVLFLIGFYCLSGLIAIPSGNARSVINMIWQWIGLGLGYFLLRQLVHRAIEARVIVAVMIAMAVAAASHGLFQYCWEFPQMRADYAQNPDAMLRATGEWYPPGSVARKHFEDRVNSHEPLATFALTNSLAGFLAPWLILTVGLLLQPVRNSRTGAMPTTTAKSLGMKSTVNPRHKSMSNDLAVVDMASDWSSRFNLVLILLMMVACFILTKSRTAWAAVALGGLGLGLWWKLRGRRISLKWTAVGVVVILLLVGLAIAVGGLDSQVVGEAGKSLKYRFEYWQATTKMIAEEPWFGTGPGRYQDIYCQFKLPEASEEPTDPHNFLFEVAATAGLFALASMVAILVLFTVRLLRTTQGPSDDPLDDPSETDSTCEGRSISGVQKFIYFGALCGYLASFFVIMMGTLAPSEFVYWGALPIGMLALLGLNRWVRRGTLSPGLIGIAWGVLLVNLLAAGGLSFPGVATSFWVLLALGMCGGGHEAHCHVDRRFVQTVCYLVALVIVGLLVAFYVTAYRPVLASQSELNAALREPRQAEEHLRRAAEADPWSAKPWIQLSSLTYQRWENHPTPERFDAVVEFSQEVLDRLPSKPIVWFTIAEQNQEAYRRMRRPADQQRALDAYRRAVELYPNQSLYRAQWALALQAAGNEAESRREAEKSLDLDRQNPHSDRRLPKSVKERLEKIVDESVE